MDFKFTEEQLMIRDTAEAFLAEFSGGAVVREQHERRSRGKCLLLSGLC